MGQGFPTEGQPEMTLKDRFYFRFGLLHGRYGRMWAGMMAFVAYVLFIIFCIAVMWGVVRLSVWWYEFQMEQHLKPVKQEAKVYQQMLLACMRGGVIAKTADGEVVACEGAFTFRVLGEDQS